MKLFISSLTSEETPPIIPIVADYMLIPLYGQSLSLNVGSTYPTLPETTGSSKRFEGGLNVVPDNTSVLEQLTKRNETMTNIMRFLVKDRDVLDNTVYVGCTPGAGGAKILNLSKGTTYYDNLLTWVTQLKRLADGEGKTMNVPCIPYVQGEEDMRYSSRGNSFTYHTDLIQLAQDFNTDIKAITGQTNDIILMPSQVASNSAWGRYPRIAFEQLKGALLSDKIQICHAMYNGDYVAIDEIHAETETYGFNGAQFGVKIKRLIDGYKDNNITINTHSYNNLKSIIVFNVPNSPLVFDGLEVLEQTDGNKGFKVFNGITEVTSGTLLDTIAESDTLITNVSLIRSNTVEITYSKTPNADDRLTYGIWGDGWQYVRGERLLPDTGRVIGPRGNLRDSQGEQYNLDVYNKDLITTYTKIHNWCPMFEIDL